MNEFLKSSLDFNFNLNFNYQISSQYFEFIHDNKKEIISIEKINDSKFDIEELKNKLVINLDYIKIFKKEKKEIKENIKEKIDLQTKERKNTKTNIYPKEKKLLS